MLRSQRRGRDPPCWLSEKEPLVGKRRVNFQRCWLPSAGLGCIAGVSKESTAVQSCWTWVKRAFILPIRAAFQAATMRAMSMPMCAGWRRYAGPVSSSGSTPTNGASPMIWSAVPPPMTPAETVRPAFASFPRSI